MFFLWFFCAAGLGDVVWEVFLCGERLGFFGGGLCGYEKTYEGRGLRVLSFVV